MSGLILNILVIGDVGNVFKTISKYVKKSKIHIINFPKDGAGVYTYDENYELFENYKVRDQGYCLPVTFPLYF